MSDAPTTLDEPEVPLSARYPPYVRSEADRERWDLVGKIAEAYVAAFEDHPDPHFVWYAQRQWYFSDIPTGSPEDLAISSDPEIKSGPQNPVSKPEAAGGNSEGFAPVNSSIDEAELASKDKQTAPPRDHIDDMFDALQAEKPAPGSPREDWYAHMGKVADFLDAMFGDPDAYDFGDLEITDGDGALSESIAGFIHGQPYKEMLHPRDRMGKWSQKLNGMHQVVLKHRDGLRQALAGRVAAVRAKVGRPGATPQQAAAKATDVAQQERFMQLVAAHQSGGGLRGAARRVQKNVQTHRRTPVVALVNALTYIGSEHAEKEHPLTVAPLKSAEEMHEFKDRAEISAEVAHKVAEYAYEHRTEIGAVLREGAKLLARAKGIQAADEEADEVSDEDLQLAEAILVTLGYG